jgi:hypothetical protein
VIGAADVVDERRWALIASLVAVAIVVVAAVTSRNATSISQGMDPGLLVGPPLTGGSETTLEVAERTVSFANVRPSSALANDDSISHVYIADSPRQAMLVDYGSGLRLTLWPSEWPDPVEYFSRQIADGIPGTIIDLSGTPAFLVPQTEDGLASITFVRDGVAVSVVGHGDFTSDQLVETATSIPVSSTG